MIVRYSDIEFLKENREDYVKYFVFTLASLPRLDIKE